ncbi:glucose 1-dehydrogenase [Chloroflexus sp.]|uniref:glucose 1-dehydrogenase n=1 Tax=Chloroflexus sp. TaxID=1904827 RepID=UPI00298F0D7E|nr:glucose 1-dehydrogenase [Chloroflexus sp.]MDW8402980.1 glucose 1-dehydrogenase [Chloroflexus sp.]
MDALVIHPGSTAIHVAQRPVPAITAPDDVLVRVIRVGICGTDRDIASGGRAKAPDGAADLVIGHEMFGRVEAVGANVSRVQAGDFAVFTVRRGCGQCLPCVMNRPDMCHTGAYRERGIWGLDGYQTELVVDKEAYVVRVPADLEAAGVLTEPLSVAEKAIDEAQRIQQARLPDAPATPDWLFGRRCLVAGLGPIGLLAALALRLHGAEVYGLDVVDANTVRPQWLQAIGGHYLDGRVTTPSQIAAVAGAMELIFEATGVPAIEYNLLDALAPNGIYVLTGIPGGDRPLQIPGAELMRRLVLNNQAMIGSVNAARDHFQLAVNDLLQAQHQWGSELLAKLITHRYPYLAFADALSRHDDDEIKIVLEWEHT